MIQGFYGAVLGAQQQMVNMNVHGNNIANINSMGFKAKQASFQAAMYTAVTGAEEEQLPRGSGALLVPVANNFSTGVLERTDRLYDYAIDGDGFFGLYDPETGEVSFTRDGAFSLSFFQEQDEDGEWVTVRYLSDGEGRQVLDTGGYPLQVPEDSTELPIGVFEVQYLDGMQNLDSSRFLATDKAGTIWIGDGTLCQGFLESSNTDLATQMARIIETQRCYSYALSMVTTADEVETTINGLANG